MSNFTKQEEFLDTLKNPQNARTRKSIKKFRKYLSPWNWKVSSRFNESKGIFTVRVRNHQIPELEKNVDHLQVYSAVDCHFSPSIYKYKIDIHQKRFNDITFWVTVPE